MASPISTTHPDAHLGTFPSRHWLPRHWPNARWTRPACAALGAWLAASAFALEHAFSSRVSTFVVGIWIASTALGGAWSWPMRVANTIAAIWLGAATLWMSEVQPVTLWNNLAVAAVVLLLSLIPWPEEQQRAASR
jgi:hypothetical protein